VARLTPGQFKEALDHLTEPKELRETTLAKVLGEFNLDSKWIDKHPQIWGAIRERLAGAHPTYENVRQAVALLLVPYAVKRDWWFDTTETPFGFREKTGRLPNPEETGAVVKPRQGALDLLEPDLGVDVPEEAPKPERKRVENPSRKLSWTEEEKSTAFGEWMRTGK
jgi:hypothetical protein